MQGIHDARLSSHAIGNGDPIGRDCPVNPLQQLIADAMKRAGMPLEQRGSISEAARRCDLPRNQFGYVFSRERYVPTAPSRDKIRAGLGIPARDMERAAYETREGVSITTVFDEEWRRSVQAAMDTASPEQLEEIAKYARQRLREVKRQAGHD